MNNCKDFYFNLHFLKFFPPCNCNRDRYGKAKCMTVGGTRRNIITSQSIKHAIRKQFKKDLPPSDVGTRTKYVAEMVSEKITEITGNPDLELAENAVKNAGINSNNGVTDALIFLSDAQATALAQLAVKGETNQKLYHDALSENPSADIALFGRMVANDPILTTKASVYTANAFSTQQDFGIADFYTALDDRKFNVDAGAAMIGEKDLYSACFYFNFSIDLMSLKSKMKEDTGRIVEEFVKAALFSNPSGGISNSAHNVIPNFVYASFDEKLENFSAAFDKPVSPSTKGCVEPSIEAFCSFARKVLNGFFPYPIKSYFVSLIDNIDSIGNSKETTLMELPSLIANDVNELLHIKEGE